MVSTSIGYQKGQKWLTEVMLNLVSSIMLLQEKASQKVLGFNPSRIFLSDIYVKVSLFGHLKVKLVHCKSVSCMMC